MSCMLNNMPLQHHTACIEKIYFKVLRKYFLNFCQNFLDFVYKFVANTFLRRILHIICLYISLPLCKIPIILFGICYIHYDQIFLKVPKILFF